MVSLYAIIIPIIPPIALVKREVKDKGLIPMSIGAYPPTDDPTIIPNITAVFADILLV